MKTYKVILSIYNNKENRINQDQREAVLKTIKEEFGYNKNQEHKKHYPYFYNSRFYFGDPIVLNNVTKAEIDKVLNLFKRNGFNKYWLTYKYRTYSLNEIKKEKISIYEVETQHNERVFLTNETKIFISLNNLVRQYKNKKAIIREIKD